MHFIVPLHSKHQVLESDETDSSIFKRCEPGGLIRIRHTLVLRLANLDCPTQPPGQIV